MKTKQKQLNEEGFAAIVIAMTLIIVLSLVTVGFATLMRKEQRSALDKHLSSQAYYAAESGVNDAAKAIYAGYSEVKSTCGPLTGATDPAVLKNNQVGEDADNKYTCLLIDPIPNTVEYSIPLDSNKVTQISGYNPTLAAYAPISTLVISWEQEESGTPAYRPSTGSRFPSVSSWNSTTGVIRLGLTPLKDTCMTRDCLIQNNFTAFLYPSAAPVAGGITDYGFSAVPGGSPSDSTNGPIIDGGCSSSSSQPADCNVRITNLGEAHYLMTLKSLYKKSHVKITAYNANGQVRIKNAQTMVDSTGKAQDVLRRIQVRVPSRPSFGVPDTALDVMNGICKQLEFTPTSGNNACAP